MTSSMSLYVLDTDILTLFQRNHAAVMAHVAEHSSDEIAISVITVEEQLSGWYSQLRKAKDPEKLAWAYRRLAANVRFLASVHILDFELGAVKRYQEMKRLRLKVRKLDLQIAATALEHGGIVVTRNIRDFRSIPGLTIEDWSK
jgi:tRNA(fMet)-specific endonuclease VapC